MVWRRSVRVASHIHNTPARFGVEVTPDGLELLPVLFGVGRNGGEDADVIRCAVPHANDIVTCCLDGDAACDFQCRTQELFVWNPYTDVATGNELCSAIELSESIHVDITLPRGSRTRSIGAVYVHGIVIVLVLQ